MSEMGKRGAAVTHAKNTTTAKPKGVDARRCACRRKVAAAYGLIVFRASVA
jgi:hypothetical protein